jgi:hypothetical protein
MNKFWILTATVLALGVITRVFNNEIMNWILISVMFLVFGYLTALLILNPLLNWLFGVKGFKHYTIKKNENYSSFLPIFKPYFKKTKIKLGVSLVFQNYTGNFNSEQVSKIFGFNQGLPKLDLKTVLINHANSKRIGFRLKGKEVEFVEYSKVNGVIQETKILKTVELKEVLGVLCTDIEYFDIETEGFGYFLPRPYFGGSYTSPCDIHFKMQIK